SPWHPLWCCNFHTCLRTISAFSLGALLLMVTPGSIFAQDFVSPIRIAHGAAAGEILVSDSRLQAVISNATDKKGRQVKISVPGRPVSVAYGWERYFVGNESTQTVDVLNKKGRRLYTLGGKNFLIQRPSDIAVDIDQELVFVTDPINARVLVFHRDGDLINTLPAAGQPPLYLPSGITVDPVRGEVLVSDFGSGSEATINIYDYSGALLAQIFGNAGCGWFSCATGPGNFSRPQGLVVNEQGLIYVVDSFRSQVLVFDRETLQGIEVIGTQGTGAGDLLLPLDILIEPQSKDLYVTSNRTKRVEVFSGKGLLP
ncbi:MAG: 6-bladed beta-propeller, partial [Gammaproteobacteria bacterium]